MYSTFDFRFLKWVLQTLPHYISYQVFLGGILIQVCVHKPVSLLSVPHSPPYTLHNQFCFLCTCTTHTITKISSLLSVPHTSLTLTQNSSVNCPHTVYTKHFHYLYHTYPPVLHIPSCTTQIPVLCTTYEPLFTFHY